MWQVEGSTYQGLPSVELASKTGTIVARKGAHNDVSCLNTHSPPILLLGGLSWNEQVLHGIAITLTHRDLGT